MDMRAAINVVEGVDELAAAVQAVADYILHNDPSGLEAAIPVIRESGYREVVRQTTFYRALFQEITPEEQAQFATLGELFAVIEAQGDRFEMGGLQGFSCTLEGVSQFAYSSQHMAVLHGVPLHDTSAPLEAFRDICIVYTVEAPADAVMLTMQGLKAFVEHVPQGPARRALDTALNDIYDGYGSDDEAIIDTSKGVRITGIHLFDNGEFLD